MGESTEKSLYGFFGVVGLHSSIGRWQVGHRAIVSRATVGGVAVGSDGIGDEVGDWNGCSNTGETGGFGDGNSMSVDGETGGSVGVDEESRDSIAG